MEKLWLNSYPPGVAADIDPDRYGSLVHMLEESFHKFGPQPAYVCMDQFLSYAELDAYSKKLGAWLQSRSPSKFSRASDTIKRS